MEPIECYTTLYSDAGPLAEYALAEALEREVWYPYFGFQAISLAMDHVFSLCPTLETIHNTIAKIKGIGVTKMLSGDYYKLHKDTKRGVGINMLLQHGNSFCAYVDTQENKTLLLDYQLNTMYLFNTQVLHTVFDFEEDRYMFTVEFEDTRQLLPYRGFIKRLKKAQKLTGSLSLIE